MQRKGNNMKKLLLSLVSLASLTTQILYGVDDHSPQIEISSYMEKLREIANYSRFQETEGLSDEIIMKFLAIDSKLRKVIDKAYDRHCQLRQNYGWILEQDEISQRSILQYNFLNLSTYEKTNLFVAIAVKTPWIVTSCGAVIYDGNAMATNPQALDIPSMVLSSLPGKQKKNAQTRSKEFLEKLQNLAEDFPPIISYVQGSGQLFSIGINENCQSSGAPDFMLFFQGRGLNVMLSDNNSLCFSLHFKISKEEIDLIINILREGFEFILPFNSGGHVPFDIFDESFDPANENLQPPLSQISNIINFDAMIDENSQNNENEEQIIVEEEEFVEEEADCNEDM